MELGGFAVRLGDLPLYEDEIRRVEGPCAGRGGARMTFPGFLSRFASVIGAEMLRKVRTPCGLSCTWALALFA